jgi:acetylornithine deacetylase/succinyl-diaminopimelate desuccinylase-like protein
VFFDRAGEARELMMRSSFNVGVIEGGSGVNAIPTSARAKLDLRSESAEAVEQLGALVGEAEEQGAELENRSATGGKVQAAVRLIGSRPGGSLPADAPLLRYLKAVEHHLGIRTQTDGAATDANIPLSRGIPAVSIGAGGTGGGAHTPLEWYHPGGRDLGLKRILLVLTLLMRDRRLAGGV